MKDLAETHYYLLFLIKAMSDGGNYNYLMTDPLLPFKWRSLGHIKMILNDAI